MYQSEKKNEFILELGIDADLFSKDLLFLGDI